MGAISHEGQRLIPDSGKFVFYLAFCNRPDPLTVLSLCVGPLLLCIVLDNISLNQFTSVGTEAP